MNCVLRTPRIVFLVVLLPFTMYLSSCKNLKELECTGVKGFKVNNISTEGIDGDIQLSIKNPNKVGFSIYKSTFDIRYSGVYLGKAKLRKKVHIKANREEIYSFNIKNDFKDVNLMDIMKVLGGASFKNQIEVKGDLKVGKIYIKRKIPVDLKEKLSLD